MINWHMMSKINRGGGALDVPLTAVVRVRTLTAGERVTVLAGVALDVLVQHRAGRLVGPVHPRHVLVDAAGRPWVRATQAPSGWTAPDDLRAVRRLGQWLALDDVTLARLVDAHSSDAQLTLLLNASPAPLPDLPIPVLDQTGPPTARRRSSGRATRSPRR